MKYRVTTDQLMFLEKGEIIYEGDQCYHDGQWVEFAELIECFSNWFEPVEEVQDGQYWKWHNSIYRINNIGSLVHLQNILEEHDKMGLVKKDLQFIAQKLSTDEIEEALIKRAKRRGYPKKQFNSLDESLINFSPKEWVYDDFYDALFCDKDVVYMKGEWAETKPHVDSTQILQQLKEKVKGLTVELDVRYNLAITDVIALIEDMQDE